MSKFFVKSDKVNNEEIIIDTDDVNHIKNVLRKNIGDTILVCDYEKSLNYNCKIKKIGKKEIVCEIVSKKQSE
ncbi:MAG: 16S rRNA (uracil(1498)-N(3))-methyltransferase, partial [Clostridia bacterium]|nr:16S rRNA (uracil(1498)-N(3))-methyltransferase [Clostridia bacterium]